MLKRRDRFSRARINSLGEISHDAARRFEVDQGEGGQVRRPSLHRHPGQGAARRCAVQGVRRRPVRNRPCLRRFLDRRLEGHPGIGHAAHARCGVRLYRSFHGRNHAGAHLRRGGAVRRQGLRPRSALAGAARRGIPEVDRPGRRVLFHPEPEFFIFDSVEWNVDMAGSYCKVFSEEAAWASGEKFEGGNIGHRPTVKGGYFPVPPVDSLNDIRAAMVLALQECGVEVEVHHHEVATAGQCEIGTKFGPLVRRADMTQLLKYIVHNVAHSYGKTATFMPKPIVGDNGSDMHCHQSVWKDGKNLFAGNGYAGLSEFALYYIGGIIRHARALNAITNPGTNSYKRLVPHYEAPTKLAYSRSEEHTSELQSPKD